MDDILEGKSVLSEEVKKNTGVCQDCGKIFTQGFRIDSKTGKRIFNKYKYCEKCRKIISKKVK